MINTYTFKLSDKVELQKISEKLMDHPRKQILIQVLTTECDEHVITMTIEELKSYFPLASILGITSSRLVVEGVLVESGAQIIITTFDDTRVELLHLPFVSKASYLKALIEENYKNYSPKCFLVYGSSSTFVDMNLCNELFEYMDIEWKDAQVTGALSADQEGGGSGLVFSDYGIIEAGLVIVGLLNDSLEVSGSSSISWAPMGKKMTVTKSDGIRVYTLDEETPVSLYEKYLGDDISNGLPYSAFNYPMMKEKDNGSMIISLVNKYKDGSIEFYPPLHVGDQIRLGFFHVDLLKEDVIKMYLEFNKLNPQAIFVFSCASRVRTIGEDIIHETKSLAKLCSVSGIYGYRGIFKQGSRTSIHGQTMVAMVLSEGDGDRKPVDEEVLNDLNTSDNFDWQRRLHRYFDVTVDELESANDQLAKMAMKDPLTGLFNRRYFDDQLAYEIKRHTRAGNELSLIMFDIDNFKAFNDTYGHVVGDDCLRGIGHVIGEIVKREADIACRYDAEEFAVILPETEQKGAIIVAEKLRSGIEKLAIPHASSETSNVVTASFGLLTVKVKDFIDKENIEKLCDQLMYQSRVNGMNKLTVERIEF